MTQWRSGFTGLSPAVQAFNGPVNIDWMMTGRKRTLPFRE
jgi:hypothetical protein